MTPNVRIGVTGHRHLAEPADVARRVDEVIDRLVDDVVREGGHDGGIVAEVERVDVAVEIEVWSSLAEGADRLVATAALRRPGARLIAVLPVDPDDYRTDFGDPASVAEFDALLGRADRVEVCGPDASGSRTSAYERAGHAVLEGCDVLLALWDGAASRGRGGTAEVVDEAHRRRVQVLVVPVERAAEAT